MAAATAKAPQDEFGGDQKPGGSGSSGQRLERTEPLEPPGADGFCFGTRRGQRVGSASFGSSSATRSSDTPYISIR